MLGRIAGTRYVVADGEGELGFTLARRREAIRIGRAVARSSPPERRVRVVRTRYGRRPREVWAAWGCDGGDGDGEDALVPRRPRPRAGSGAAALPLPQV